jgi:hypothetical protein
MLCCLAEGANEIEDLAVEVVETAVLFEDVEKDDLTDLVEAVDPPE